MDTIPEIERAVCPKCKKEIMAAEKICAVCASQGVKQGSGVRHFNATGTRTMIYTRFIVYASAALYFVAGIAEGFVANNSMAMAINFSASLLVLAMASYLPLRPVIALLLIVCVNVVHELVLPLLTSFPRSWDWLKALFFGLPLSGIVLLVFAELRQRRRNNR